MNERQAGNEAKFDVFGILKCQLATALQGLFCPGVVT